MFMGTGKRKVEDRCSWAGHTVASQAATPQQQQAMARTEMIKDIRKCTKPNSTVNTNEMASESSNTYATH